MSSVIRFSFALDFWAYSDGYTDNRWEGYGSKGGWALRLESCDKFENHLIFERELSSDTALSKESIFSSFSTLGTVTY
jgi:hypothetical protein